MYMAAARHWKIRLNEKQVESVRTWRHTIVTSLKAGETTYLRSSENDPFLTLLFPDLTEVLATTTGMALLSRFAPNAAGPVNRDDFYTGAALERWLQEHPDLAPAWVHLRR